MFFCLSVLSLLGTPILPSFVIHLCPKLPQTSWANLKQNLFCCFLVFLEITLRFFIFLLQKKFIIYRGFYSTCLLLTIILKYLSGSSTACTTYAVPKLFTIKNHCDLQGEYFESNIASRHCCLKGFEFMFLVNMIINYGFSVVLVGTFIIQMLYIYWCSVQVKAFCLVWLN